MKKVLLFIGAQALLSNLILWTFRTTFPPPTDTSIDWLLSISWLSMLAIPFIITGIHWVKSKNWRPFASIGLCATASLVGFASHYNVHLEYVGYHVLPNVFIYVSFACLMYALDQKHMAYIGGVMAVFGAALIVPYGLVLDSKEAGLERLALCILYAAQMVPPVSKILRKNDGPKSEVETGRFERHYQEAA